MQKVSIVKCENYEYERVRRAVKKSLDLIGGLEKVVKPGNRVLLKTNLLLGTKPEKAVTTHPAFVKAMAELVKEAGGIPWIGDSSGAYGLTGQALRLAGIEEAAKQVGAELLNFEATGAYRVELPNSKYLKEIYIAKPVLDCDVLISLPKMKTHMLTRVTGAVKNFLGIIPGTGKGEVHLLAPSEEEFCEALVDIYSTIKPRLAVMDGIVGMEGQGASNGTPINSQMILASHDCLALDAVQAEVMGFHWDEVLTTKYASQRGLGIRNMNEIRVIGEKIKDVKIDFKRARAVSPFLGRLIFRLFKNLAVIVIEKNLCKACGICSDNCPAQAISVKDYAEINKEKCIECYCCQELCPHGAVKLKYSWLGKKLFRTFMPGVTLD